MDSPPIVDFLLPGATTLAIALLVVQVVARRFQSPLFSTLPQRLAAGLWSGFGAFLPFWPICCCGCGADEVNSTLFNTQMLLLKLPAWLTSSALEGDLANYIPPRGGMALWFTSTVTYSLVGLGFAVAPNLWRLAAMQAKTPDEKATVGRL